MSKVIIKCLTLYTYILPSHYFLKKRKMKGYPELSLISLFLLMSTSQANLLFSSVDDGRGVVTDHAMGARCAVAADFDGDGRLDIVSASSNDNAVSWFRNEGTTDGIPTFSIKQKITWSSLGSCIVTVADLDGDGDVDVVGASYYDSSLRWYENDGTGVFIEHLVSSAVNEGQGVTVADFDNDGDADTATASSGDNTIAVFKNIANGTFCEIKEVVDGDAIGARTVIAVDLNGDGWLDLASASKDDSTVAWYPNDGTGHFKRKIIISAGDDSMGAYSLVAADIDMDGSQDLIVASNGNDHVSLWRNDGTGNFSKTLVYDNADFVLSVTAVDFDRDGDIDLASASFFDGHINWYENIDGKGYQWRNHTIYVGIQGHYVSHADMDGDGDEDLIAVTHADNTVAVFYTQTRCNYTSPRAECCLTGTQWNGTTCEICPFQTFGVGEGADATCDVCPVVDCSKPDRLAIPTACVGVKVCQNVNESIEACACSVNSFKDPETDSCILCPEGQWRPEIETSRTIKSLGNYSLWESEQGSCRALPVEDDGPPLAIIIPIAVGVGLLIALLAFFVVRQRNVIIYQTRDVKNAPKDGLVAVVFTDIQGSTALWDTSESVMSTAIKIHHDLIRKVIDRHLAYEVKTIGDSFMIALSSVDAAVELANDIQSDLLNADWPMELASMPSACVEFELLDHRNSFCQPKAIFRGLRVRIGVHCGEHRSSEEEGGDVQINYDEVAKGYDYYGPAINTAARIESTGYGGQTLISSAVHNRMSDNVKKGCHLKSVGGVDLKGVREQVFLYQCLPKTMSKRTFPDVVRRRNSMGISIISVDFTLENDDTASMTMILNDIVQDDDLHADVMSLTKSQLRDIVKRLRNKIQEAETSSRRKSNSSPVPEVFGGSITQDLKMMEQIVPQS